ncbi:MAG TPA: hypothetical protein VGM90_31000 [Kofleriaceae bacterium]|jgi:hypothetical protein
MRSIAAAVLFAAFFSACGTSNGSSPDIDGGSGSSDDGVDARPEFMCWPSVDPIPRGTVELGKGGTAFSEMPEVLNLQYGFQGGFMVKVWTRMTGIDAGEAGTTVDSRNPATRVRGKFVDSDAALQLPGDCGDRGSYVANATGGYDYYNEIAVVFNTCWGNDSLVGKQLKITAELMDASGSYATDSKTITVADILDPTFQNIPTTPGCGQ